MPMFRCRPALVKLPAASVVEDLRQEQPGALRARIAEELLRRRLLDDLALVHEDDAVGDRAGKAHLVRDDQHGHARARQLHHHVQHLLDHLGIERRGRLVEQHDARVHAQRAGDRHALLLPARELPRILVGLLRNVHAIKIAPRQLLGLRARHLLHPHRAEAEIVQHGQMREEVEALEHHADLGAHPVDLAQVVGQLHAVDDDAAVLVRFEAIDAANERGLARARGPADDDLLALVDGEVDVPQDLEGAEPLADADQLDRRVAGASVERAAVPSPERARCHVVSHGPVWRRLPRYATKVLAHTAVPARNLVPSGGSPELDFAVTGRKVTSFVLEAEPFPAASLAVRRALTVLAMTESTSQDQRLARLMRSAQDGDAADYTALLQEVAPFVRQVIRRRFAMLQPQDVEDLVQDVLLSLHSARATYDPTRPFLPWLLAIVRNRVADGARRYGRRVANEIACDTPPETSAGVDANISPETYRDREELAQAMATLPPGQRRAIELTKLQEMSLQEAATVSGTSVGALKVAVHRGIGALRKALGANGGTKG